MELLDKPIVEATDFENCHKIGIHLSELLKKRFDLFGARTDLPAQHCVPIGVPDTNGDLPAVLVNGEVQHLSGLLDRVLLASHHGYAVIYQENRLSPLCRLFHRITPVHLRALLRAWVSSA
jgi:hypothetical protein